MNHNLECDICGHTEKYDHENDFFQDGIMHGMRGQLKDEIHCIDCISKNNNQHLEQRISCSFFSSSL